MIGDITGFLVEMFIGFLGEAHFWRETSSSRATNGPVQDALGAPGQLARRTEENWVLEGLMDVDGVG
jgi:hypothetical protein